MRKYRDRALLALAIATVSWGALAFGAVYTWAYVPLATCAALIGIVALTSSRRVPAIGAVASALAGVAAAACVQLLPLPVPWLARVSPAADSFMRRMDFAYALRAVDGSGWHPISLAPGRTALGLALFGAFALFTLGMSRLLSRVGAKTVTVALLSLGVVLALVGLAQAAVYPEPTTLQPAHIYGVWAPENFSFPFGPFINRNHFAGWMLMTIPLGLAFFYDALQRILQGAAAHRRDTLALIGSAQVGTLMSAGAATLLMSLSLLMTRSRSGLGAFAIGSALAAAVVLRRQPTMKRRLVVAAMFSVLLVATATWAGVDTVIGKFTADEQGVQSIAGRRLIWGDATRIARDFRLTGTGLNTFGTAMIGYQSGTPEVHYFEAHNDYLQIASEGGLLLVIPSLIAVVVFALQVRRRFREAPTFGTTYWIRVGAVVGMVSVALQSLFEFSLQMPGNAVLFALLMAVALHESPNLRATSQAAPRRGSVDDAQRRVRG
jgi:O-antigen ligase